MSEAAEAVDRGAAFVRRHGDAWARLRLDALRGVTPVLVAREALGARLRPDGSLAPRHERAPAGARPAWAEALEALAALDDLRSLAGPEVEAVVGWLASQQRDDGGWGPAADGDSRSLVATGLVAGYLARTPFAPGSMLEAAGRFLGDRWSPERVAGGAYGPLLAFAHFFSNAPHEQGDSVLQWCGRELERGYRAGAFDALRTFRVLVVCDAHSLPGGRLDAAALVAPLLAIQAEDGGWLPGAAPALRAEETLAALVALTRATPPSPA